MNKYVFVFDFDLTMTIKNSNGINANSNFIELFDNENKIIELKHYLNGIRNLGHPVYINTRALVADVKYILKTIGIDVGPGQLIKEIKGSDTIDYIHNPFSISDMIKYDLINQVKNESLLWAVKKVTYLNKIIDQEKISIENTLFFDDSLLNINTAKINGFINSYLVGSDDSGIYGLDYLLIKLDQILSSI
jgi:hypothetical protein